MNNLKPFLALSFTILFFLSSCKKTDSDSASVAWSTKKTAIQNKVKSDLTNLKALLPYTISRAVNGDVSFDNQKINEYFRLNNASLNKISTITKPKSTNDIIASIKAKQLSSITPIKDGPGEPIDEENPYEVLTSEGYRYHYRVATENYTDLSSYVTTLNAIQEDIVNTFTLTEDEKVMMYTEIEYLKQYATDLETNPDYWINLYAPSMAVSVSSTVKDNSIMLIGGIGLEGTLMAGNAPSQSRKGCKVDTRAALMNGVVGGFIAAVGYAKVGAVAGTVSVPGVGTVTGAVSGFMAGFAVGFVSGVAKKVVTDLLLTCGR